LPALDLGQKKKNQKTKPQIENISIYFGGRGRGKQCVMITIIQSNQRLPELGTITAFTLKMVG
jgi:hypothetical protein